MAEALEAPVGLARYLAVQVIETVQHVIGTLAGLGYVQVLHRGQLGYGEAVVHLHHADLPARVLDARLLVGHARGLPRGKHPRAVPVRVERLLTGADRYLQRFHLYLVIVRLYLLHYLWRGYDGAGGPVAHPAAVKEPQRVGDHRCRYRSAPVRRRSTRTGTARGCLPRGRPRAWPT